MKWKPKHRRIEDIMKDIGFVSVENGWALYRKPKTGKPVRYHLAPDTFGYDLHADYDDNGKHTSVRYSSRDNRFIEILDAVDRGEKPTIGKKLKNNYPTILLKKA